MLNQIRLTNIFCYMAIYCKNKKNKKIKMKLLCIIMFSCILFNNMLYYIVLFDKCCVYIKLNPNGVKVENTMT